MLTGSIADVRVDDLLRLLGVRGQSGRLVVEAGGDEAVLVFVGGSITSASGWAGDDPVTVVAQIRRMRVGTFRFETDHGDVGAAEGTAVGDLLEQTNRLVVRDSLRELRTRGLVSGRADPDEGAELIQELAAVGRGAGPSGALAAALDEAVAAQAARDRVEARVRASLRRR